MATLAKFQIIKGLFWLILTVYHEARGESPEGQKNVTKVILNRADKNGWPVEDIVLARKQFSCYNNGINTFLKDPKAAAEVSANVYNAIDEWLGGDRLRGADHYYAPQGMAGGKAPGWVKDMELIGRVGNHIFYKS